jgi:hypothetical protein
MSTPDRAGFDLNRQADLEQRARDRIARIPPPPPLVGRRVCDADGRLGVISALSTQTGSVDVRWTGETVTCTWPLTSLHDLES